ncbi:PRC and DUF2382 domain-containing protein [soil metagenome]
MTQAESSPVSDLIDRNAVDSDGSKIGTVSDVYLDNQSGQPEWLAVATGMFGSKVSFVPIAGAELVDDDVMVGYPTSQVKDAPRCDADGELSPEEEDSLYAHYGTQPLSGTTGVQTTDDRVGDDQGYDTSGPETDDAMTRSEEQIDVSTQTRQAGTARLRKWIETEDVQMTVPIRREKARMVTEPVTDANRDAAMSGGDLTDEEHEVTLSEEVVDVSKRVVPKERVRLEKEVVTEEVSVDEQVRKERIEMDEGDDDR